MGPVQVVTLTPPKKRKIVDAQTATARQRGLDVGAVTPAKAYSGQPIGCAAPKPLKPRKIRKVRVFIKGIKKRASVL